MIGKLLKYEWKATYKTFLCMYGALGIIFVTAFLGKGLQIEYMSSLAVFAMSCAVLPVGIIYFVTILNRYQKNIYGAEGYLTNTLPVKTWEILLSKLLVAVAWGILTLVVGVLFGILMMWSLGIAYVSLSDIPLILGELARMYGIGAMLEMGAMGLTLAVGTIIQMYLAISIANLPVFKKLNGMVAMVCYFALGRIAIGVINVVFKLFAPVQDIGLFYRISAVDYFVDMVNEYVGITLMAGIGLIVVYFLATHYILKKHFSIR